MNKAIILDHDRDRMALGIMMRENPSMDILEECGTYTKSSGEVFSGSMHDIFMLTTGSFRDFSIAHHDISYSAVTDDNYVYRNTMTKREAKAKRATNKKERQRKKKGRR